MKTLALIIWFIGTITFFYAAETAASQPEPVPQNENVRDCDSFNGASAGIKIAACIAALPSTGGVADASHIHGQQIISNDIFAKVPAPIILELSAATYTVTTSFV